jgi:glc operon protein GlcG
MSEKTRAQQTVTRAGAHAAVAAGIAKAEEMGIKINIAVVDAGGHLVAFERMDGAMMISTAIAQDKAWSVVMGNGLPTENWWDAISGDPGLQAGFPHRERLVVFGGGVPIELDGQLVGAVGVSGGSAEEDVEVATAGVNAVK